MADDIKKDVDMDQENGYRRLSEEQLDRVSGGEIDGIPGMHYDVTLGIWVEDGPSGIEIRPGSAAVRVGEKPGC